MASLCPPEAIDRVLEETGRPEQRVRLLPSRLVACSVVAMALYSGEGYRELDGLMVEGLRAVERRDGAPGPAGLGLGLGLGYVNATAIALTLAAARGRRALLRGSTTPGRTRR